ncbi:uncharacterized protein LOC118732540 [Rhagoletis pomonella]|uniref:uncharacterized protein LOC118732540 n=1 Tax=Rhagoletis pomonella TaxID=28610 RepID=UPI001785C78C|nr:uncharacterized protein LOC118732540 [Rhagoletis pomonella]
MTNNNSCILCGEEGHNSLNNKACKRWQKEEKILEVMTIKKISKREAMEVYSFNTNNQFSILDNYDEAFPPIKPNNTGTIDKDRVINRKLTTTKYSYVTKRATNDSATNTGNPKSLRQKSETQPVYENPKWNKVTEIEKLVTLLIKKFEIDREEPLVKLLENICKVNIDDRLIINTNDECKSPAVQHPKPQN